MSDPRPPAPPPAPFRRFARDEDGSFVVLGLYLLIVMLLVCGISVDIMRHDFERTRMQGTLDGAVLAAADLDQRLAPEDVVSDHFAKAGMLDRLGEVTVTQSANSRAVSATAAQDVPTLFMRSVGIDSIGAAAAGTAREDTRQIEVSLVLDISGSMATGARLPDLKEASSAFVDALLPEVSHRGRNEDDVSISLVPYSTQVSVPPVLRDRMARDPDRRHERSGCIDFPRNDFSRRALPFSSPREQVSHFDPFTYTPGDPFYVPGSGAIRMGGTSYPAWNLPCRTDAAAVVTVMSKDRDALLDRIAELSPSGNTSSEIGLKWGIGMLDPSFRGAAAAMADAGLVDDAFRDRPFDYDRDNAIKVVVLMSDGENTSHFRMRDQFDGATPSDIWAWEDPSTGATRWSVADRERDDRDDDGTPEEAFYLPAEREWADEPLGGADARQVPWEAVWAEFTVTNHALWFRAYQYMSNRDLNWWATNVYTTTGSNEKDRRMASMCAEIKSAGVLLFTVGLEINDSNARKLRDCASSPNHFFDVDGREIVTAFTSIAGTINALRLTQ